MKKFFVLLAAAALGLGASAQTTIEVYDHVTFYDGYLVDNIPEFAPDEGCTRLYTYLVTKKLTDEQLESIGTTLTLNVQVHALCDNYDRIGSVNLALIPKGQESYQVKYNADDPQRLEIARFITPFMDMNKEPSTVPYTYNVDYLSNVLRDSQLRSEYDFWLELMIFGVPYAANSQIKGCSGRNDVFMGSVQFVTDDTPAPLVDSNVLVPISIRTADWRADRGINNYNEACTDEIGKTIKTYTFDVPENCQDGRVVFVISNHGAGTNGEEYERRYHYVYYDNHLKSMFKPGRQSCEPFRQYNTQANGIYGSRPRTDETWQSFSNWCPGDVIDNRFIELGAVEAGQHSITISVPSAVFYGQDGYFPVSLFFQGDTEGQLPSGIERPVCDDDYDTTVTIEGKQAIIKSQGNIDFAAIYTLSGELVTATAATQGNSAALSVSNIDSGIYIVVITTDKGTEARKTYIAQ